MKKDIVKPNINLILECCQELGIKVVPAKSTECIMIVFFMRYSLIKKIH